MCVEESTNQTPRENAMTMTTWWRIIKASPEEQPTDNEMLVSRCELSDALAERQLTFCRINL
jgi:hypothetical protein